MASLLPRTLRSAARVMPRVPARSMMSGGAEEVDKWKKISMGMSVLVVVLTAKELVSSEEHGHHDDGPKPAYMHVRHKPYPWECSDCSPFDRACFKACKEAKADA